MRIAIDATVLDRGLTGTGRFLYNILKELPNRDKQNEYYLITGSNLDIDKNFYKIIFYKQNLIPYKLFSPFWFNFILPKLLKQNNIELLFAPNVLLPLINLNEIKTVTVVHDIIFKIYKEYYPLSYRIYLSAFLPQALKKTDVVVTVSEHSKSDIIKYYKIPSEKIEVVYNTASDKFNNSTINHTRLPESITALDLPQKYILFVGAIEKRKNIFGLLQIIDMLVSKGSNLKLVLVGRSGYGYNQILPEIEKRKDSVKYYGFLNDQMISIIYKFAFAFIFPSYYEGFGIPPLEAMQCGIPVLASNTSALPEVIGNGGIIHNPTDYDSFVGDILKLENDSNFYNLMKEKALEQSKRINIKDSTQKLVSIFNKFL